MSSSKLTDLVPSTPYALAYTLPLLLISVLQLFAGSFLTLDRTRSFTPTNDIPDYSTLPGQLEIKKKRRISWLLEGGVGGLAIGYTFGVHISTFLALLIPATTSSASLSPKSFLALWILSCVPTTVLAGRFRLFALLFAGITGGTSLSLGLALILHPALLPRQILLGVFSTLITALLLVGSYVPRFSHILLRPVLRLACAATGAFGLVLCIALLAHPPILGWTNIWTRFWVANGDPAEWATPKEKGLSAAWAIFAVVGSVGDWALRRWVGECPDEKWDSYLSRYVLDPPNYRERAGTFRPLVTFWDRVLGRAGARSGVVVPMVDDPEDDRFFLGPGAEKGGGLVFPYTVPMGERERDRDVKHRPISPVLSPPLPSATNVDANYYSIPPPKPTSPAFKLQSKKNSISTSQDAVENLVDDIPSGVAFLRKKKTTKTKWGAPSRPRNKKPVRFGSLDTLTTSVSSDDDDEDNKGLKADDADPKPKRPMVVTNQHSSYDSSDVLTSSATTLVDGASSKKSAPNTPLPSVQDTVDVVDIDYDRELGKLQGQLGRQKTDAQAQGFYESDYFDHPVRTRPWKSPSFPQPHLDLRSDPHRQPSTRKATWSPKFLHRRSSRHSREEAYDHGDVDHADIGMLDADVDVEANAREVRRGGGERETPKRQWDEFWREVKVKASAANDTTPVGVVGRS